MGYKGYKVKKNMRLKWTLAFTVLQNMFKFAYEYRLSLSMI